MFWKEFYTAVWRWKGHVFLVNRIAHPFLLALEFEPIMFTKRRRRTIFNPISAALKLSKPFFAIFAM